jgi:hypothetical protein
MAPDGVEANLRLSESIESLASDCFESLPIYSDPAPMGSYIDIVTTV